MNICVIIPVYNESKTIASIVQNLKAKQLMALVIDDGSCDNSGSLAQAQGAIVLRHLRKEGKGKSLRDGFRYALEHHYDGVISIDGDGQHEVADISNFLEKAQQEPSCVIVGNRMGNYQGMPFVRLCVNRLMSAIISMMCRQKVPDTQCGYRYIGCDVLKKIQLSSSDYEIESEVLTQASRKGFNIYSVPIKTIYRSEISKINPFVDTCRFFVFVFREVFIRKNNE